MCVILRKQKMKELNLSNARSENESYIDYRARLKRNKDILKTYFTFGRDGFREMFPNGVGEALKNFEKILKKDVEWRCAKWC